MSSKFLNLSTDNTLGGNSPSDNKAVSEKAIKEYVDNNAGQTYTAGTGLDLQNNEFSVVQDEGIVATVVGTLTESDGVYSGFSDNDYLTLPTFSVGSNDEYEMQFKFSLNSNISGWLFGAYFGVQDNYAYCSLPGLFSVACLPSTDNSTQVMIFPSGTSWSTNTPYWINIKRTINDGSFTSEIKRSIDGINWTTLVTNTISGVQASVDFTSFVIGRSDLNYYNPSPFDGSIDIKGCYVKKNGDYWWNPNETSTAVVAKATNSLYGLVKPDGSTITVNNGVISASASFPSQTGNAGKFLTTNGTNVSWASITIPTVNNATLTIQQNGTTVNTFTANASTDVTANIQATQVVWRTYTTT